MTYTFLLESIWHPPLFFAEARQAPLPPELELQALWFSGAFGRDFKSTDGKIVRVIQFGEWNRGEGPDFSHVAIEIDGVLWKGDLELDSTSNDWESHGHSANATFNNVILHVVFQSDSAKVFIKNAGHKEIPQVSISEIQLTEGLNTPARQVAIARPGRCFIPLRHMAVADVEVLLTQAASHRAVSKARRFLKLADAHSRDIALYQATAETLGYRANVLPMRLLAQRVPLASFPHAARHPAALLFGTAGFLSPELHERADVDVKEYLRELWEDWWHLRDKFEVSSGRSATWKTYGQRPANHPHRRVGALAEVVRQWQAYRKLALARPFEVKAVSDFLQSLEHPFWSHRHTLSSGYSSQKVALFGRAHAQELLTNHLVPLALHDAAMTFKDYTKLRNSTPNEKVRRCALRLFGSLEAAAPWLKRVYHQQALMQIYHDFCLEDYSDCEACPFPEQLSQWKA